MYFCIPTPLARMVTIVFYPNSLSGRLVSSFHCFVIIRGTSAWCRWLFPTSQFIYIYVHILYIPKAFAGWFLAHWTTNTKHIHKNTLRNIYSRNIAAYKIEDNPSPPAALSAISRNYTLAASFGKTNLFLKRKLHIRHIYDWGLFVAKNVFRRIEVSLSTQLWYRTSRDLHVMSHVHRSMAFVLWI